MSDFTKSIVYSGFVLVAGLIAIFAISSNMTAQQGAETFAVIEPAAGGDTSADFTIDTTAAADEAAAATAEQSPWASDEALDELRKALKEAGVSVSEIEPAAGDEGANVLLDTIGPAE